MTLFSRTKHPTALFFTLYFAVLTYFEFLLRYYTIGYSFRIMPVIFNICTAILLTALARSVKANRAFLFISVLLLGLIYGSQIYYYTFFDTYYIVVSLLHAGMVAESYSREIFDLVYHNFEILILVNLPLLIMIVFRKQLKRTPCAKRKTAHALLSAVALYSVSVFGIMTMDKDTPVYDAYVYQSDMIESVRHLGLLTTITVDITRYVRESIGLTNAIRVPETVDEGELPVDETPNILPIPFESLIAKETNPILKSMHAYYSSRSPSAKNEKTGLFKDYNLIVITAETFSRWAVREDITPTLYRLVHSGYVFTDFYVPLYPVSTSDGEYMGLTSQLPKAGTWSMKDSSVNDMNFVLGHQLSALGYTTYAFHNNDYKYYRRDLSHPNLGYTFMGVGNGLTATNEWPQSDLDMMKETIPMYINQDKFHVYYMTVSGHSNYYWDANAQAAKNRDLVKDLPYIEYAKGYLAAQIELEKAVTYLLDELQKAGRLDDTLIVLSADHYPYNFFQETLTNINNGIEVDMEFDVYRSPLIIYNPSIKTETITKPVCSLDLLPTIANLMGLPYDSRLMMGTDAFSPSDGLVIFKDRSFITSLGRYDVRSKTFTPNSGVTLEPDYVDKMIDIVNAKFYYSQLFLEKDYYKIIDASLSE